MSDGKLPVPDDAISRRRRVTVRKRLYQRLWGGRTAHESPLVVFLAGNPDLGRGYVVDAFERNFETEVYRDDDRHDDRRAFVTRDLHSEIDLSRVIAGSRAPGVVFVAGGRTADAIHQMIDHYSPARALWFFENYQRFIVRARRTGDRAAAREWVRQLVTDEAGGDYGRYSMPDELVKLAAQAEPDADTVWALAWFALHDGFRQHRAQRHRQIYLVSGESLIAAPQATMNWLFEVVGVATMDRHLPRRVKSPRRSRHVPKLPGELQQACDELLDWLRVHSVDVTRD